MKLKVFLIGLVTLGAASAGRIEGYGGDDQKLEGFVDGLINKTINKILSNLSEPIAIDNLGLKFDQDILRGFANVSKFQLFGIKKLVATSISVSLLGMGMNATIRLPQVLLNTKYNADVVAAKLIPFYGDGSLSATVDDIEIQISGKVNLTGGLSLKNVTFSFVLGDATFSVLGLLNNPDLSSLVSQVLNDNVVVFINEYARVISSIISPIAQQLINAILKGGSKKDFIDEEFNSYYYENY